ncbi:site-specific DNA-methyltransferase [Methylobacterium sp. NMS14P]|uniref:DNA methyltransferase n=1 Tax=Methylobacterium sp. NMS14P TaxID=2894310 RepID=UPI002358B07F|nr:DNA methyltransferase [Methylobacterium sp. NMS14P]WCS27809.1 site-specific DNA-methyltransferase [Methylobacterium sp. NMS14P]
MRSFLADGDVRLHAGDCLDVLATLPPDRFDACVTDPPYHFASIIKRWSGVDPSSRSSAGAMGRHSRGFMGQTWDGGDIAFRPETWAAVLRVLKPGAHLVAFGAPKNVHRLTCAIEDAGFEVRDQLMWLFGTGFPKSHDAEKALGKVTDSDLFREAAAAASDKWAGWGTALKPAYEPIVLARKPLAGTVQECLREHGTGAINIDACRVATDDALIGGAGLLRSHYRDGKPTPGVEQNGFEPSAAGRWPANILHDGSKEVVAAFPKQAGAAAPVRGTEPSEASVGRVTGRRARVAGAFHADSGSAARFFYCSKATKADRAGSKHPTVKPIALMRWLCRLVVPPGGLVLDPFAGTGTTAAAAIAESLRAELIEREEAYRADIARRFGGDDAPPAVTAAE